MGRIRDRLAAHVCFFSVCSSRPTMRDVVIVLAFFPTAIAIDRYVCVPMSVCDTTEQLGFSIGPRNLLALV